MESIIKIVRIIKIGDRVERHQPGDYTNGRRGNIVEINDKRIRVKWDMHPNGIMMDRQIRTWVNIKRLIKIG